MRSVSQNDPFDVASLSTDDQLSILAGTLKNEELHSNEVAKMFSQIVDTDYFLSLVKFLSNTHNSKAIKGLISLVRDFGLVVSKSVLRPLLVDVAYGGMYGGHMQGLIPEQMEPGELEGMEGDTYEEDIDLEALELLQKLGWDYA